MLALNAQEGDVAVITAGADKGTYMLGSGSPSSFSSWIFMAVTSNSPVQSVNGQTGTVNLGYGDVGAAPATHTHTSSQVDGLDDALQALRDLIHARHAFFSGEGAPVDIPHAVVGDYYFDKTTKELHEITGV